MLGMKFWYCGIICHKMPHPVVIEKAQHENAILVTLNRDLVMAWSYAPRSMCRLVALIAVIVAGCNSHEAPDKSAAINQPSMTLEQQLASLSELGLTLNDGVTTEDLLYSFGREEYENEPFDLILFVLGIEVEREPWGRNVCSRAWNLDMECIGETGDYVHIVKRLCEVAGQQNLITDIEDFVDLESGQAWLKYTVDGQARNYTVTVNSDWADPDTIAKIMTDIERDGFRFYAKDNGQASIWYYLDSATAAKLNKLSGNALVPGP